MHYLLDLALIAVVTSAVMIAKRKGFIKSSYNVLSLIITAVLILSLQQPFCDYLAKSALGETVREKVEEQVLGTAASEEMEIQDAEDAETAVKVGEMMGLPEFLMRFLDEKLEKQTEAVENMKNNALEVLTDTVTEMILKIISILLLFILVRVGVFLLLHILEALFKLPVLNGINSFLGMIIGAVNGLLIVYIICALFTLLAPTESMGQIGEAIDKTLILKYFYNNNLLIELFI